VGIVRLVPYLSNLGAEPRLYAAVFYPQILPRSLLCSVHSRRN
jgi:hypothetical protein